MRIPRKGRPGANRRQLEASRPFQRIVRWRTGAEGRISCIKRDFGCRRTRMDSLTGARGHGPGTASSPTTSPSSPPSPPNPTRPRPPPDRHDLTRPPAHNPYKEFFRSK